MSSASPGQLSFDGGCEGRGGRPPVAAEGARLPLGLVRRVVSAEGGGVLTGLCFHESAVVVARRCEGRREGRKRRRLRSGWNPAFSVRRKAAREGALIKKGHKE